MHQLLRFIHLDMNKARDQSVLKKYIMRAYDAKVSLRAVVDVVQKKHYQFTNAGEAAKRARLAAKL